MTRLADRINKALSSHGYTQVRKVGEGSFGAAILCQSAADTDRDTKSIVKMIDISKATNQERKDALKESKVLSQLRHPFIVKYRENFLEDGWLCIVMDYCEGGDLSDRIKRQRAQHKLFSEEQVLRWFTQAVLALKYIHDTHILHRDLKSGNFFLSKTDNLKMGDFGIARVLECTNACAQTQIGTPYYLSPEICSGKPYSWGSDIWSMGCILFELCAKKVPFEAPDLKGLIRKITSGSPPEIPSDYSVGLRQLCKEMLHKNPDNRPHTEDILKRPLVQDIVKRMLQEVKDDEDKASLPVKKIHSGESALAVPSSGYQDEQPKYKKHDNVEFYSETHKDWLPAIVINVDDEGRILVNLKPTSWLTLEVQAARVRPSRGGNGANHGPNTPAIPVSPARRSEDRRPGSRCKSLDVYAKRPSQESPFRRHGSQGSIQQTPSIGSVHQTPSIGSRQDVAHRWSRGGRDPNVARVSNNSPCISTPSQSNLEAGPRRDCAAGMPSGGRSSVSRVPTPGRYVRDSSPGRENFPVATPNGVCGLPDLGTPGNYVPSFGRAPVGMPNGKSPTPDRVLPGGYIPSVAQRSR